MVLICCIGYKCQELSWGVARLTFAAGDQSAIMSSELFPCFYFEPQTDSLFSLPSCWAVSNRLWDTWLLIRAISPHM